VPVPAPVPTELSEMPDQELLVLMRLLSGGPTERQRAAGLSTALTPGVVIDVLGTKGEVALVQVESQAKDPPADRLPLAIGQVVLTATAVPGIAAVQLIRDGMAVEVPLPGGALTSQPLSRADYRELLRPASGPAPTTSASPG
jgi:spore germination protein GerM